MAGADLAREVSTPEPYTVSPPPGTRVRYRVAAVDLGIKAATPRSMAAAGLPGAGAPGHQHGGRDPGHRPGRGVLLQRPRRPGGGRLRGGGRCAACSPQAVPLFGICLGSQILGRALGLGTYKLRFGHRGVNQPVKDLRHRPGADHQPQPRLRGRPARRGRRGAGPGRTGRGRPGAGGRPERVAGPFETPFGRAQVSHVNLNDGVVEGLRLLDAPAFSVQYHPEAAPGPHDAAGEFDAFCALMERAR